MSNVRLIGLAVHAETIAVAAEPGQLTALGVKCGGVAPTFVPVKAGDRVKTDRRDALKLARSYRAGDLTAVWVPDAAHEALRDLVRSREAAKKDQLRARHRVGKFLLRQGRRPPTAALRKRQATASAEVKEIASKAQHRLHGRYRALPARGKCNNKS
jgi:transposase